MSKCGGLVRHVPERPLTAARREKLKAEGVLAGAEGLDYPPQPKIVRATRERKPSVTDGPFAETKEVLFGYWLVKVDSPEQAYEIAARASAAPGQHGFHGCRCRHGRVRFHGVPAGHALRHVSTPRICLRFGFDRK